jgi:hypothetical protein
MPVQKGVELYSSLAKSPPNVHLGIIMSTLVEIEDAVLSLPFEQQETLLQRLQSRLSRKQAAPSLEPSPKSAWLARLAALRQRGRTGVSGTSLQQIMDDIRGD